MFNFYFHGEKGSPVLEIRAEYGSFEYNLYWGMRVFINKLEKPTLLVISDEEKYEEEISKSEFQKFIQEAEIFKIFELPSSNYKSDLSDDLYHLSISLFARKDSKIFEHQVPTGVMVGVSTQRYSTEQLIRFASFISSSSSKASQKSKISIPNFVTLKLEAAKNRKK